VQRGSYTPLAGSGKGVVEAGQRLVRVGADAEDHRVADLGGGVTEAAPCFVHPGVSALG